MTADHISTVMLIYYKCKNYLYKLMKRYEMQCSDKFFWSVLQRVQINLILIDNVLILYLSCNVQKH